MDIEFICITLKRNAELVELLGEKNSNAQAQWKPDEKRWSILEKFYP